MYSTTDFRKGLKIEVEGIPYEIVDFQHFKDVYKRQLRFPALGLLVSGGHTHI